MSRKISPTNPVRRVLWPATDNDETNNDNFSNKQREEADREMEEMSQKWHYDFKNDCPLPGEGNVKWFECNDGELIGEIQDNTTEETEAHPSDVINSNESNKLCSDNNNLEEDGSENGFREVSIENSSISNESELNNLSDKEEATVNINVECTPVKDESPPKKKVKDGIANNIFSDKNT